jgi:AGZA family xanthine/uracil permease-like MFS transporter
MSTSPEGELEDIGGTTPSTDFEDSENPDARRESGKSSEFKTPKEVGDLSWFDRFFEITERQTNLRTEIFAGVTTFLSMCYILTVNPNNLCMDGMELGNPVGLARWPSVFIATCFGSLIGTLLMAFLAKMPYAQAPGMGLNSAIGVLVAFGDGKGHVYSYDNAMALGFIYAIVVLLLTLIPVGRDPATGQCVPMREKLFDGIPPCVRAAIPVGIGLFIAFLGLQDAKMVIHNQFTLVDFVDWTSLWREDKLAPEAHLWAKHAIVCLFSFLTIAILTHYHVPGAVVIGILVGTIIGIPLKVSETDVIAGKGAVSWKFWTNFESYFRWDADRGGVFFGCFRGFKFPAGAGLGVVMNIISLGMVDLFDTMGTVVGCSTKAGLNEEDGKPGEYGKTLYADSLASLAAAALGTSSVTTFVESGSGIAAGGKTGVVALVVSIMFFLSIFLAPIFAFIPGAASGAALIYVGVLMMTTVGNVDFSDVTNAVSAFLTIAMMPFSYSITDGIGLGMLTYILIHGIVWLVDWIIYFVNSKRGKEATFPPWTLSVVTLIVGALFLVYFFVPMA